VYLHMFIQEDANQLCFRVVYHTNAIDIEAGWGQAMYVFEAERGRHEIVECVLDWDGKYSIKQSNDGSIRDGLRALCELYGNWILAVGMSVSNLLGVETFAFEGYFDPTLKAQPVVVDIDLPLDFVWNVQAS
jgi:hypothetical protein